MLILPIVNKRRVMNIELRLKNATKIRTGVSFDDASESEIIVNSEKFTASSFHNSKDAKAPIDFIRSKSILYPRNFLVTTKTNTTSQLYDVYEVPQPPKKVNNHLDELYSRAITDMRKEIPGRPERGRYVSFQDLGIGEDLSDDKIALLQQVIKEERDTSKWKRKFQEKGIISLIDTVDFIKYFDCTILSDSTIPEESLQDSIRAMSTIHTRDYKNLKKYYSMAKDNANIYAKISYINKLVYDENLVLGRTTETTQKQFVKRLEENDYKKAA